MSVTPSDIDTDRQPPMTVPLRHFLVGLAFLLLGGASGAFFADGSMRFARLGHVHLLLVGWVCVTIMGAMTQFVPVWSNVPLHSRRLASAHLWLTALGVLGLAGAFFASRIDLLPLFGLLALSGFWLFVYNLGRTLSRVQGLDVTERHFALALGFFVLATGFGFSLALDFATPLLPAAGVTHSQLLAAHATLAVFSGVLTTVVGALYQLGTMFTQTELRGVDHRLRDVEEVGYPLGVVLLAAGRLVANATVARLGATLVLVALLSFSAVLLRRLHETEVDRTPMLSRYAVVAASMALWALLTAPTWFRDPLSPASLFGPAGGFQLLAVGVVGFVVMGSLYHVVPFIVWVHQYSDLLGLQDVPMINDLYDDRVAAADFWAVFVGSAVVVLAAAVDLPRVVAGGGSALLLLGFSLFALNVGLVVRDHAPNSFAGVFIPSWASESEVPEPETAESR